MGFIISAVSFVLGATFLIGKMAGVLPDVPGWTSLATLILFIGGVQLFSIGMLGEYIGRVYDEVKKRPPYIISRSLGLDNTAEKDATAIEPD